MDSSAKEWKQWKQNAEEFQKEMNELLCNRLYDEIPKDDLKNIDFRIGFALYGPSINESTCSQEQSQTINNPIDRKIKLQTINNLKTHIFVLLKNNTSRSIFLFYTYVNLRSKEEGHKEDVQVLFKLKTGVNDGDCVFFDPACRTYKNWKHYLETNDLPECDLLYPENGIYSCGHVNLLMSESPACKKSKTILRGLDTASAVLGTVASGVGLASLAVPIAGPIVVGAVATLAATSSYDIGRNVETLIDLRKHEQGLSLTKSKSRSAWLSLATSALGVASVGGNALTKGQSTLKMAKCAKVRNAVKISTYAFVGVQSVNIIEYTGFFNKIMDCINDMKLKVQEFQKCCLFFFNIFLSEDWSLRLIEMIPRMKSKISAISARTLGRCVTNSITTVTLRRARFLFGFFQVGCEVFNVDLVKFRKIERKVLTLIADLVRGRKDRMVLALEMVQIAPEIWFLFKESITNAKIKLRELFTDEDARQLLTTDRNQIMDSNVDVERHICSAVQTVFDMFEIDLDDRVEFMKDIILLVKEFNNRFDVVCSNDVLNRATFVCVFISKSLIEKKEFQPYRNETDGINAFNSNLLTIVLYQLQNPTELDKMHDCYVEYIRDFPIRENEYLGNGFRISRYQYTGLNGDQHDRIVRNLTGKSLHSNSRKVEIENTIFIYHNNGFYLFCSLPTDSSSGILLDVTYS